MPFSNAPFGAPLGGKGLHRPLAEINVTPMVDVMLVLLVVFMVTAPMLATGLKVDVPQAKASQTIAPKDPIVGSVTSDGNVAVGTETMAIAASPEALMKLTGGDSSRVIQVRADKAAPYGTIVEVIDQLATNDMVHVALIADNGPDGTAPQPQAAAAQ